MPEARADNIVNRTIFTADNILPLRRIADESIDLIYLDPPFNSKKQWSAPVGSAAAGAAFKDTWTLSDIDESWVDEIAAANPGLARLIEAVGAVNGDGDKSYLIMMAIRLIEMRRVLKPTGSLYLHCDPTMSHALKLTLDAIFGGEQFRSEITWKRYAAHSLSKGSFDNIADIILIYSANKETTKLNRIFGEATSIEMKKRFPHVEDETGRRFQHAALEKTSNRSNAGETRNINGRTVRTKLGWIWSQETIDQRIAANPRLIYWTRNGRPRYKIYADEYKGTPLGNIWVDIPYLSSGDSERVGYPTQKPLALLERIIKASSDEGDWMLDPFCGCATACVAAEQLGRRWIGIDISEKAAELVKMRFGKIEPLIRHVNQVIHRKDLPDRNEKYLRQQVIDRLYAEQDGCCKACDIRFSKRNLTLDHIVPRGKGGPDIPANLQLLCGACNSEKGTRSMAHYLAIRRRAGG